MAKSDRVGNVFGTICGGLWYTVDMSTLVYVVMNAQDEVVTVFTNLRAARMFVRSIHPDACIISVPLDRYDRQVQEGLRMYRVCLPREGPTQVAPSIGFQAGCTEYLHPVVSIWDARRTPSLQWSGLYLESWVWAPTPKAAVKEVEAQRQRLLDSGDWDAEDSLQRAVFEEMQDEETCKEREEQISLLIEEIHQEMRDGL